MKLCTVDIHDILSSNHEKKLGVTMLLFLLSWKPISKSQNSKIHEKHHLFHIIYVFMYIALLLMKFKIIL